MSSDQLATSDRRWFWTYFVLVLIGACESNGERCGTGTVPVGDRCVIDEPDAGVLDAGYAPRSTSGGGYCGENAHEVTQACRSNDVCIKGTDSKRLWCVRPRDLNSPMTEDGPACGDKHCAPEALCVEHGADELCAMVAVVYGPYDNAGSSEPCSKGPGLPSTSLFCREGDTCVEKSIASNPGRCVAGLEEYQAFAAATGVPCGTLEPQRLARCKVGHICLFKNYNGQPVPARCVNPEVVYIALPGFDGDTCGFSEPTGRCRSGDVCVEVAKPSDTNGHSLCAPTGATYEATTAAGGEICMQRYDEEQLRCAGNDRCIDSADNLCGR